MTELPYVPNTTALPPRTPRTPPHFPPHLRFINRDSETYVSPLPSPLTNPLTSSTPSPLSRKEYFRAPGSRSYSPGIHKGFSSQVPLSPLAKTSRRHYSAVASPVSNTGTPRRSKTSLETPFVQLDGLVPAVGGDSVLCNKFSSSLQAGVCRSTSTSQASTGAEAHRRAVLIGITYAGTKNVEPLPGSAEHLALFHNLLIRKFGFDKRNIWLLCDKPHSAAGAILFEPSQANIINAMTWLVLNSRPGDSLIFAFCGHGLQRRNDSSKSIERCIIPSDYPTSPPITANTISSLLIGNLNMSANLTVLLDCRFSNKMLGLPYIHYVRRARKNNFFIDGTPEVSDKDPLFRASPMHGITGSSRQQKEYLELKKQVAEEQRDALAATLFDKGEVVCISLGSEPRKKLFSFSSPRGGPNLSSAFVSVMSNYDPQKSNISFQKMLVDISALVSKGQHAFLPQLSSSYRLKIEDPVFKC